MVTILEEFYKVLDIEQTENSILAQIELNPEHQIYAGHFPEIAIVPGVCQMELVRELLSETIKKKLYISSVSNMKFLAIINPALNKILTVKVDFATEADNSLKVSGSIFFEAIVFFKFSGVLK